MRIAVYANSNATIGEGHAIRCLSLVMQFESADVTWFCSDITDRVRSQIEKCPNVSIKRLPAGPLSSVDQLFASFDIGIVDDYQIDLECKNEGTLTVVFDDLANRMITADVLIDANPLRQSNDYDGLVDNGCVRLIGARYLMLGDEYFPDLVTKEKHHGHLFLGSTDPLALTYPIAEALLQRFPNWHWSIVVTTLTPHWEKLKRLQLESERIDLIVQPASLADGLLRSEIAIGAPGTTTWQRLAAACKSALIATHPNQIAILEQLHERGIATYLGDGRSKEVVMDNLIRYLSAIPETNPDIDIDGLGAARIKRQILSRLEGRTAS